MADANVAEAVVVMVQDAGSCSTGTLAEMTTRTVAGKRTTRLQFLLVDPILSQIARFCVFRVIRIQVLTDAAKTKSLSETSLA